MRGCCGLRTSVRRSYLQATRRMSNDGSLAFSATRLVVGAELNQEGSRCRRQGRAFHDASSTVGRVYAAGDIPKPSARAVQSASTADASRNSRRHVSGAPTVPRRSFTATGLPVSGSAHEAVGIHNGIRVWRPRIGSNGESGPVAVVCRRVVMVIGSARMIIVMDALLGNAASVPARMAPLLTRRKSLVDRGGPGGETQQPLPTLNEAPVGGHDVRTRAAPASAG